MEYPRGVANTALTIHVLLCQILQYPHIQATRQVRKLSEEGHYKQQVTLLRSIPGIGLINAMLFLTEIGI